MPTPRQDPENSAGHWARAKVDYAEDLTRAILKLASIAGHAAAQDAMERTLTTPGLKTLVMERELRNEAAA